MDEKWVNRLHVLLQSGKVPLNVPAPLMFAVLHRVPNASHRGLLPLAGRPLIEWQLDWLYSIGCAAVMVEIAEDDQAAQEVAAWVAEHPRASMEVDIVRTEAAVGPREVACRAGVLRATPILAIPNDMLGEGEIGSMFTVRNAGGVVACFEPPRPLARLMRGGTVRLVRAPIRWRQPMVYQGNGWAVRLASEQDAEALGRMLMSEAFQGAFSESARPAADVA
jgi:hypothetical protein